MDGVFAYRPPGSPQARSGPLAGLRVAIQPNMSVAGWPADAGSKALAGFEALEDATVVRRLRAAGAWLCGSTRMSEFGLGLHGSQAGCAVVPGAAGGAPAGLPPSRGAVARQPSGAGGQQADAELVLDLMGESRLAAARAGLCGFKPSYGLVSRWGLIGLIPSMECCGVLSPNLDRVRGILQAVAGNDGLDYSLPDEGPAGLSPAQIDPGETIIGVISEAGGSLPAEDEGLRAAADELREAGFPLRELSFPDFPLFSLVHRIAGSVEASSCAGRYDSVRYGPRSPGARNWNQMYLLSRGAAFGPLVKSYLFQGAFFQFERYEAFEDACRIRTRLLAGMRQLASQADFLLLPAGGSAGVPAAGGARGPVRAGGGAPAPAVGPGTAADACPDGAPAPGAPPSLAGTYAEFASTLFANVTGQPALYVPPPPGGAQGFQMAGPRLGDARLLSLGELLLGRRRGSI